MMVCCCWRRLRWVDCVRTRGTDDGGIGNDVGCCVAAVAVAAKGGQFARGEGQVIPSSGGGDGSENIGFVGLVLLLLVSLVVAVIEVLSFSSRERKVSWLLLEEYKEKKLGRLNLLVSRQEVDLDIERKKR